MVVLQSIQHTEANYNEYMKIAENIFLVGGGASGLGYATAQMIIQNKGKVVIADINTEAGIKAQQILGQNSIFIKTDVADENSVKHTIDKAVESFGMLNGLINCAGLGPAERILGKKGLHRLESFQKTIQINLIGTFNLIRFAAAQIEKNEAGTSGERGVIINTASVAAFDGQIGQAAYSASKGGIVAMTLPIAREFARVGIRVLTIAPGIFETPMLQNLSDDIKKSLGQQVPFPSRLGQPEEFASLVKQMIENQMLNGEVIRLDGAIRMAAK